MTHGLSDTTVARICEVFARYPAVEQAVLYGSRAKGTHKPGSDIDLTLLGNALAPAILGQIADELDDLLLPYTFDLSRYADLDHASLREHIDRVGVVFYRKTNHRLIQNELQQNKKMNRQDAKSAKEIVNAWRSWRLGGSFGLLGIARVATAAGALLLLAGAAATGQAATTNLLDLAACEAYAITNALRLIQRGYDPLNRALETEVARQRFASAFTTDLAYSARDARTDGTLAWRRELPGGYQLGAKAANTENDRGDWDRTYTLDLAKRILGGGSIAWSRVEIANSLDSEQIAALELQQFRRELLADVRKRYYQVLRNRQTLTAREFQLERARRNLASAVAREEPLDIATAQIEVPENEANVLRARRAILSALDALQEAIGLPFDQVLDVLPGHAFQPETIEAAADLAWCLSSHEEVRILDLRLVQLDREAEALREEVAPVLLLGAQVRRDELADQDSEWDGRLTLSMAWSAGLRTAHARLALKEHAIETVRLERELVRRRLRTAQVDLARRLEEALLQVELSRNRLAVAGHRAKLYEDRWQNGEIDILEYVRSQNDLEENRIRLINDQIAYLEILADYRALCGP